MNGSTTIIAYLVFASYNTVMLCFALNIFISFITESFDKVRRDAKQHPEDEVEIFKYLKEIWSRVRGSRVKKIFVSKKANITNNNYVDHLCSFHIQTNKLIDLLAAVILCLFFYKPIYLIV